MARYYSGPPRWQRVMAPQGSDVLLPAPMSGQYLLFFPSTNQYGSHVTWQFRDADRSRASSYASTSPSYSAYSSPSTASYHTFYPCHCGYPYSGTYATASAAAAPPPPPVPSIRYAAAPRAEKPDCASTSPYQTWPCIPPGEQEFPSPSESPWAVFNCDDPKDPHTAILIKSTDKMIQCRPASPVHICKMSLEEWEASETHNSVSLGSPRSDASVSSGGSRESLGNTRVAFTDEKPATHIFCDGYSIHLDYPVRVTLTTPTSACRVTYPPGQSRHREPETGKDKSKGKDKPKGKAEAAGKEGKEKDAAKEAKESEDEKSHDGSDSDDGKPKAGKSPEGAKAKPKAKAGKMPPPPMSPKAKA